VAKFSKSGVWDKVPEGSALIFGDTRAFFVITQCGIGGKKPPCQNQLDSYSRFNTIPACDRRTDRRTRDDCIGLCHASIDGGAPWRLWRHLAMDRSVWLWRCRICGLSACRYHYRSSLLKFHAFRIQRAGWSAPGCATVGRHCGETKVGQPLRG